VYKQPFKTLAAPLDPSSKKEAKDFNCPEWIEVTYLPTWRALEANGFTGVYT
jgi:hypothetical protein